MSLEPIQIVALLIAASMLVFVLARLYRPGRSTRKPTGTWSRVAHEASLAVLAGGVVSLAALALVRVGDLLETPLLVSTGASRDPVILGLVVATLVLLCAERGRWIGHEPATLMAAAIPWLLVPEWSGADGERAPAELLGLVAAALYRVALSGARSAQLATRARHAAVDATGDGVLVVDSEGGFIDANGKGREAFEALATHEKHPRTGRPVGPPRLPRRVRRLLVRPDAKHFSLRNKDDRVFEVWLGSADAGDPAKLSRALIVRDVSEQRRDEKRLLRLAHYDSLTGLANRRLFVKQLDRALVDVRGRQDGVALLYIDLDRFKEINDTLGHGAGDELLRVLAERFQESLRTAYPPRLSGPRSASVARLGGDEFAVLVPEPENMRAVEDLARGLLQAIAHPVNLAGREINASGSIGIALYPSDGRDVETLVKHADSALYGAKRLGRNRFERYKPEFSREADRNRAIENELRGAIERGEFELHYQPKVDVSTSTVGGFEALLRWMNRELGAVGPEEFIPIAEERGLIATIGAWCLEEACRQQREWIDAGYEAVPVAVNVSSAQFIGSNLQELVRRAITRNSLDPALVELELTERLLLEDSEQTSTCLADLQAIGVALALDDFGTGYSALTYLNRFPLNVVKMDRGLLQNIETSDSAAGISAAVIAMCHSLELEVVAEGVDSEGQLELLREMSCDQIQGFLFSPALRAADAATYLATAERSRPTLKPKPSLTRLRPETRSVPEIEVDSEEMLPPVIQEEDSATTTPRALIVDDAGNLEWVARRLEALGVETRDVTRAALEGCYDPSGENGFHLVVAPVDGDLYLATRILDQLSEACEGPRASLLVVGEEPAEERRREIREAGARMVLWAPFDDAELRFVIRAAMPDRGGEGIRQDVRIPMDEMAWIRFRSQREVGVLSSLSRRGAFIEMAEPLQQGISCKLEFDLPDGRISTFAKVLYQQHDRGSDGEVVTSGIGVSFYGIDPASDFTIGELIEKSAARYRP